jgi:hypothetical protein
MAEKPHFLTDAEKAKAVTLYKDGKSVSEIAEKLDRGWKACQAAIVEAGIYTPRGSKKPKAPKKKKTTTKKAPAKPAKKPATKPATKKPAASDKHKEEIAYLTWCMKGAVHGWLERLVKDLGDRKFA